MRLVSDVRTGSAPVSGLQVYVEVHGGERPDAVPLLLLGGAYMTTADFGPLLPGLARERTVVVADPQGHGRTGDADRPLSYDGLADDVLRAASDHLPLLADLRLSPAPPGPGAAASRG